MSNTPNGPHFRPAVFSAAVALLWMIPHRGAAQVPLWLAPGHRIRVMVVGRSSAVAGVVTSVLGDSLVFRGGDGPVRLRQIDVRELEVSRARRSGVALGAAIGLGVGVLAGIAVGLDEGRQSGDGATRALVSGLTLGALGAPLGALIGTTMHHDVWARIQLPIRVGSRP